MRKRFTPIRVASILFVILFYTIVAILSVKKPSTLKTEVGIQSQLYSAKNPIPYKADTGALRAQIALGEYKKGVHEDVRGCNCGKDVDKYTLGLQKQWCAMFASWVFDAAGTPLSKNTSDDSWRIEQARSIADWLKQNGTWYDREDVLTNKIQPQIGDVVVFWRGDFEGNLGHADIVVGVDESRPGIADLVGGNIDNQVTYRQGYFYAEHYGFLGFGRP